MNYGSVCSGIEAASLAWNPLGWKAKFVSEVEPFPAAVLCERWNATRPLRPLDPATAPTPKDRKTRELWAKAIQTLPEVGTLPNLGDFTKIRKTDYDGKIDLLVGGTPCFVAGTLILTSEGYRPIEDIRVGDLVVTHLGNLRRVVRTGCKRAETGLLRAVGNPSGIECTENHPFLSVNGESNWVKGEDRWSGLAFDAPMFRSASDCANRFVVKMNTLAHPLPIWTPSFPVAYGMTRADILEFAGWYLGDGYIRRYKGKSKKGVTLCLNPSKLRKFINRFGSCLHCWVARPIGNSIKVTISCTDLADWLIENFGELSHNKTLPGWCFGLNAEDRRHILAGYESTDGHVMSESCVRFTTTSKALAYSMADFCANTSVSFVRANATHVIDGRTCHQRDYYNVLWHKNPTNKCHEKHGYIYRKCSSFTSTGKMVPVYNLEVEGDHTYVANGYCVHNCQSFSIAGLRKGLSDPRGNLCLEFAKLAYRTNARVVVWENVPGVLSSSKGSDFAGFLSLLCGWEVKPPKDGWRKAGIVTPAPGCFGVAWRILDAQYARVPEFPGAVPQRRRRVILVGHLDSWRYPAKVLFDGEMRGGDTPPRREKMQGLAGDSAQGSSGTAAIRMRAGKPGGGKGALVSDERSLTLGTGNDQTLAKWWDGSDKADTLTTTSDRQLMPDKKKLQCVLDMRQVEACGREVAPTLISTDYKGGKAVCEKVCPTLDANYPAKMNSQDTGKLVVCYENHANDSRVKVSGEVAPTLSGHAGTGGNNLPLVQETLGFIKNDAGGTNTHGDEVFPTIRTDVTPAVAFNVSFCDANGRREDRPDGGLYVTKAEATKTLTAGVNAETVAVALDGDKMAKDVHGVCYPIDTMNCAGRDKNKSNGFGVGKDGDPSPTLSKEHHHAVCHEPLKDCADTLTATYANHYNGNAPSFNGSLFALYKKGQTSGITDKSNPIEVLFILRSKIGAKAFSTWATGRLNRFQTKEILQPEMHGESLRCETNKTKLMLDDGALPCKKAPEEDLLRSLWSNYASRHTSQGRELAQQFLSELDLFMQELSHKGTPSSRCETAGIVRRLLPVEAERLMAMPDNYTQIPWRGKPASGCPDAPRYKALGNSMCVNVMMWVGQRIQQVEDEYANR